MKLKRVAVRGTHKGKSGAMRDIHTSKGANVTWTAVQPTGTRFKTLARNVEVRDTILKKDKL